MRDMISQELRLLRRRCAGLDRRLALVDLKGKVKPGSQDMEKRTVRLVLGKSADGKDILSPPVRWQGTGAGAFKMHAVPKDHEQMTLHSASGTVGNSSLAHWGTFDKDHEPPSKDKDVAMLELNEKARVTWGKDFTKLQFGKSDDDGFVMQKEGGDIVLHPGSSVIYAGGDPKKGDTFEPVKTVSGVSQTLLAKI